MIKIFFGKSRIGKSKRGLSLVEVVLVVGVGSVFFFVAQKFFNSYLSSQNQVEEMLENATEEQLIIRSLTKDLQGSGLSFGYLQQKDDSNKPFFDHLADAPCAISDCSRILTLSPSLTREFLLLVDAKLPSSTSSQFTVQTLVPTDFYNIPNPGNVMLKIDAKGKVVPPTTFATPTMTYTNLRAGFSKSSSPLSADHLLFALYSPVLERPVDVSGRVVTSAVPQRNMLVAWIQGSTDHILTHAKVQSAGVTLQNTVRTNHPVWTSLSVQTADNFFRTLSPVGGKSTVVLARPVTLVRYQVVTVAGNRLELKRSVFNPATQSFVNVQRVGSGFDKIVFNRKTIIDQNIEIDFVRTRTQSQ